MNRFHATARQYEVKDASGNGRVEWKDSLKSGFPSVKLIGASYQAAEPTPDAPQYVLGNNATVRSCGKNLYNKNDENLISGYFQPGSTNIVASSNRIIAYIPCKPGETYTASKTGVLTNDRFAIGYTEQLPAHDVEVFGIRYLQGNLGNVSLTITTGATAKYFVVWACLTGRYEDLDTLQIEYGNTASEYEPYYNGGEATAPTLYAIGDICDEWDAQTGKGVQRIGKIEINTSGAWSANALRVWSNSWGSRFMDHADMNKVYPMVCSHYVAIEHSDAFANSMMGVAFYKSGSTKVLTFSFGSGPVYTADEWKAHLIELSEAGTPITIWYVLAEPVPFETDPMPLTCPTGYGQIVQVGGDIAGCPLEVRYLAHGKREVKKETLGHGILVQMKLGG